MAQARRRKQELRILLVGKTGSGKSATGNTILGAKEFESRATITSVTKECKRKEATVDGRRITVVNTPGFFNTNNKKQFAQEDVSKCIQMGHPGFHAILVVIRAGRITNEDQETFQQVKSLFQNEGKKYMILLFTHKDELDKNGLTIEECLARAEEPLKDLIEMSGRRFIAFNNMADGEENERQVKDLIEMIDSLVLANGRTPLYTEEQFKKDLSWGSWLGSFFRNS